MKIEELKWDSNFFEKKIGRIDVHEDFDPNPTPFINNCEEGQFDLVYFNKYQKPLPFDYINEACLDLMDIQLTMSRKFTKNEFLGNTYQFKTILSESELAECYQIAEQVAAVSRFYNEPVIGEAKTKALYRKWIDNALNNEYCDGIFLVEEASQVLGILVIKTDDLSQVGVNSLIGVKGNEKQKGIGKKLWNQAFGYWANERNIECCRVSFSLQNVESFSFHMKIGFDKIDEIKYIYHYRKK